MNEITITLKMPGIASQIAVIDIFNPSFLEINLSGLKTLKSLKTLIACRLDVSAKEITDITVIVKSTIFQPFLI